MLLALGETLATLATVAPLRAAAAEPATPPRTAVTVTVTGPTAIGFFPADEPGEPDADGSRAEALAHVQFALDDVAQCLRPDALRTEFARTRTLTIRNGAFGRTFRFGADWPHAVGIVLVRPGRAPRVVYATAGPGSLQEVVPPAAASYFAAPSCRPR